MNNKSYLLFKLIIAFTVVIFPAKVAAQKRADNSEKNYIRRILVEKPNGWTLLKSYEINFSANNREKTPYTFIFKADSVFIYKRGNNRLLLSKRYAINEIDQFGTVGVRIFSFFKNMELFLDDANRTKNEREFVDFQFIHKSDSLTLRWNAPGRGVDLVNDFR